MAGLALAVVALVTLVQTGSAVSDVARYLLVWAVLVITPGVLLWRALAGRTTTEIELGAGAGTGIALLLVAWLVATGLGHPRWSAAVPLAVLVAFLAFPRLRRHWRGSPALAGRAPALWWASMALLGALAIHKVSLTILRPSVLPPGPSAIASDTWYSLGIAGQLAQGFPVADPSFVGGQITYHWFALGLVTATSQLAGTDLAATVMHLWFVPFVVVWLGVTAALVRMLLLPYEQARPGARRWWWGPLGASLVVVVPAGVVLTGTAAAGLGTGLNSSSASGAFGSLFVSFAGLVLASLLRDARQPGLWVVALLTGVAASGIKPTVLPVVAAGCLLVAGWRLVHRRSGWSIAALTAIGALAVFGVASRVVVGSTTGTKIQPLALVVADPSYRALFAPGAAPGPGAGGFLLPAVALGRPHALAFALAVLLLFLLGQAVVLLGLLRLPRSPLRADPAAVWVAGATVAGYLACWVVAHSGFSQQWFALNVTGTATALSVVVVAVEVPAGGRRPAVLAAVALVLGLGTAALTRHLTAPTDLPLGTRLVPYALLAGLLLVLLAVNRGLGRALAPVVVAAALLLGAMLPGAGGWLVGNAVVPITESPRAVVTRPQQEAALWLRESSAPADVVVSNVFCRPVRYSDGCEHAGVWVSALTGRRLVLDGWAYIPQTMDRYDGTVPGPMLPSPFPDRLRDSLALITEGDRDAACRLTAQYGARWVFADTDATRVSPKLARFADLRHVSGPVRVFAIDPARLGCPSGG